MPDTLIVAIAALTRAVVSASSPTIPVWRVGIDWQPPRAATRTSPLSIAHFHIGPSWLMHVGRNRRCICAVTLRRELEENLKKALRKTTEDLLFVQRLGGWRTLSMVQRHAHLAPDHLRAAVERLAVVELGRNLDSTLSPNTTRIV